MTAAALALLLAQACVSEIDLQPSPAECSIMWSIDDRAAARRGVGLEVQVRAYGAYWRQSHTVRLWVGELALDGSRPAHWPAKRSWARELPRWRAYVAAAEAYLAGRRPGRLCPRATDYGGPVDGRWADDPAPCPGAHPVQCLRGQLQAYWDVRPCRVRASVAAGR